MFSRLRRQDLPAASADLAPEHPTRLFAPLLVVIVLLNAASTILTLAAQ
ncbi:MAG TPA: hypothetical protein VGU24_05240 [Microvirga sp.]|jgi:hypothetical protein|nr:hypothetical protein [Microvirga sp.]